MNFSTLFKKKEERAHFSKEDNGYLKNPHASWMLLLKIFFLLLLVVIVLSAYKYYMTDKRTLEIVGGAEDKGKDVIQVEKLDAILESFNQKEKKTLEYKETPPVFVDPS